jgi:hypothetical protein
LRAFPAFCVELAAVTHTSLPLVLAMAVDEVLAWHAEAALFAADRN